MPCEQFRPGSIERIHCEQQLRLRGMVATQAPATGAWRAGVGEAISGTVGAAARGAGALWATLNRDVTGGVGAEPFPAFRPAPWWVSHVPDVRTPFDNIIQGAMNVAGFVLGGSPGEAADPSPLFRAMGAASRVGQRTAVQGSRVVAPAVRTPSGRIVAGTDHADAMRRARLRRAPAARDQGFITELGEYLEREKALDLMRAQAPSESLLQGTPSGETGKLRSEDLNRVLEAGEAFIPPDLAHDMSQSYQQFGGSTFDPRTGASMAGQDVWAVATPTQHLQREPFTEEQISAFLRKHADELAKPNVYGGMWDAQRASQEAGERVGHGMQEINLSELYTDFNEAMRVAMGRGEARIMNLSDFREVDVPRPLSQKIDIDAEIKARVKAGTRTMKARDETDAEIFNALEEADPEGARQFAAMSEADRARTRDTYLRAPEAKHLASAILAGASARGWYANAAKALIATFGGTDSVRFAALLAATSPRTAVAPNLVYAMKGWREWLRRGRDTSPETIEAVLNAIGHPVSKVVRNNLKVALTAGEDLLLDPAKLVEKGGILSGPKVDPFYGNLLGETQRIVLDTHMARGLGAGIEGIGKRHRSLAMRAALRKAGKLIKERTGLELTGREIQEMFWTFVREGTSRGSRVRGGKQKVSPEMALLRELGFTEGDNASLLNNMIPFEQTGFGEALKDVPDFATLLATQHASDLRALGLTPPPHVPLPGVQVSPEHINIDHLRRILQRIGRVMTGDPVVPQILGPPLGAGLLYQQLAPDQGHRQ